MIDSSTSRFSSAQRRGPKQGLRSAVLGLEFIPLAKVRTERRRDGGTEGVDASLISLRRSVALSLCHVASPSGETRNYACREDNQRQHGRLPIANRADENDM